MTEQPLPSYQSAHDLFHRDNSWDIAAINQCRILSEELACSTFGKYHYLDCADLRECIPYDGAEVDLFICDKINACYRKIKSVGNINIKNPFIPNWDRNSIPLHLIDFVELPEPRKLHLLIVDNNVIITPKHFCLFYKFIPSDFKFNPLGIIPKNNKKHLTHRDIANYISYKSAGIIGQLLSSLQEDIQNGNMDQKSMLQTINTIKSLVK